MSAKALKVITLGDERLRQVSRPVTAYSPDLADFVERMFRALAVKKGLGLAAVQVGRLERIFITEAPEDGRRVFCNPEIIATSETLCEMEEGCLSVPKMYELVTRPADLRIQAFTEKGKPFTLEAHGLLARVIQHELDHLNGVLFIDRIPEPARDKITRAFARKPQTQTARI
jgi:peptide deformylase